MKPFMTIVTFVFVCSSLMGGPSPRAQRTRSVLLEARYFGVGMSGIDGDHLIARIYDDGVVQYEDVRALDRSPIYDLKTAKLSEQRLNQLSTLLNDADLGSLSESYPAFSSTLDHRENLTLRFLFRGSLRQITVENFKPDLPKAETAYPRELLSIACWAEFVRTNSKMRFFFRESNLCCSKENLCR